MSENQDLSTTHGINWSLVLQENQDRKSTEAFQQAMMNILGATLFVKGQTPDLGKGYHDESFEMAATMSVVLTDCLDASGLKIVPVIVPSFEKSMDDAVASVFKNDDGEWILFLNGKAYAEAIRELGRTNKGEATSRINLVRMLWGLAHEVGHMRQVEKLNMSSSDTTVGLIDSIEVAEIVEAKTISTANYALDKRETNANAFATRYFYTKRNDPQAAKLWRELDFSVTTKHVWTNISNLTLVKMASDFKKMQGGFEASFDPALREEIQKKAAIFAKTVGTHMERLDKMIATIEGKLGNN